MAPSYVGRGTSREHFATDSVRSKVSPLYVPVSTVVRLAWSKPCQWAKLSINIWSSFVGRGGNKYGDTTKSGKFRGSFRRPPLAEFGADAARSVGREHDGCAWHGREPAAVPVALGNHKVVSRVY